MYYSSIVIRVCRSFGLRKFDNFFFVQFLRKKFKLLSPFLLIFLADLIHLVGYINPTKRPPYNTNVYKPYRPTQRPDYGYETNHIGGHSPAVYSPANEFDQNRPPLYDEGGYGVTTNAIFNNQNHRPLYAERPDPVYYDNPNYNRPGAGGNYGSHSGNGFDKWDAEDQRSKEDFHYGHF